MKKILFVLALFVGCISPNSSDNQKDSLIGKFHGVMFVDTMRCPVTFTIYSSGAGSLFTDGLVKGKKYGGEFHDALTENGKIQWQVIDTATHFFIRDTVVRADHFALYIKTPYYRNYQDILFKRE